MMGINKHKPLVPIAVGEAIVNLLLSIALIKKVGVVGVAWGTAIPNLAVSLFFWPWYANRTLGIPLKKYMLSLWFLPLLAVSPFALCTLIVEKKWAAPSLSFFFLQIACLLPVVLLGAWFLGLSREERESFTQRFWAPRSRFMRKT
jgi:peptidoglycan biosynthesis protein MviN/MurJ (putative lipid II flippase)